MGKIRKVLAMDEIEPRSLTASAVWTDLCEDVHLHYRNIRLDFSEKEWAHFRAAIHQLGMALEESAEINNYREGDPNFLIQQIYNTPLRTDSDYYANRATIELQKDNTVHFHYRDLRLHMTNTEFAKIAGMFSQALFRLKVTEFPYKPEKRKLFKNVPVDLIQPYDEGHRPMVFDEPHRKGIEHVKRLMIEGERIRPILVDTTGQRLDGFKRYMAHVELNRKTIDCYVDPFGRMGGQHNQSFIADE